MIVFIVFSIIGILTVMVTDLADESYFFDNYVSSTIEQEQIFYISDAGIKAVKRILKEDQNSYDALNEAWSQQMPVQLDEASLVIQAVDQERYLNPNFLVKENGEIDEKYLEMFQRLFAVVRIDPVIIYNIIDWIDPDTSTSGGEEDYVDFPAKNDKIDTVEELKLLRGVTQEVFNGKEELGSYTPGLKDLLSPYSNGKVNINTASKWVLMALDEEIDEGLAEAIVAFRQKEPFTNINDLVKVGGITSDIIYRIKPFIDVKSENFIVYITINLGERKYKLTTHLNKRGRLVKEMWRKLY
ncbi:MAG: general secretion pathway protein GspK [Aquificae bacterium]|nr:general secretion pathway protein GspK [Aquificota bacterium]